MVRVAQTEGDAELKYAKSEPEFRLIHDFEPEKSIDVLMIYQTLLKAVKLCPD